jgi:ankyrin repeat protein
VSEIDSLKVAVRMMLPPQPIPPADQVFPTAPLRAAAAAAERGDVAELQSLARGGVNLDEETSQGVTLLIYEIAKKHEIAVRALLAAGANPNALTKLGSSPMQAAGGSSDPRFLEILIDAGGDPDLKNPRGEPLLHQTINAMRMQNVRVLVKRGANIEARDPSGRTTVLKLAYLNQYEEVHHLLQAGADPSAKDSTGRDLKALASIPVPDRNSPLEAWRLKVLERLGVPGGA